MAKAPVIGGFNELAQTQSACETTVNLYPEKIEGKAAWRLAQTPGLALFAQLPNTGTGMRAMWEAAERGFAIVGDGFYELFANGTYVLRGTLQTVTGAVAIDDNGLQIVIDDATKGYAFTLATNVFEVIVSPAYFPSGSIVCADAVAVGIRPGTQQFFHSALNDVKTYNAADYISAEGNPDRLVTLAKSTSGMVLLGTRSLDIYYCTADSPYYARQPGSGAGYGCAARYSVQKIGDRTIFVGRDANGIGGVFMVSGFTAAKISNIAVDQLLQRFKDVLSGATSWTYRQNGHEFYVLNVPTMRRSLVYDTTTDIWHERRSYDDSDVLGRHRAECHVFAFGLNLVGDYVTGNVYILDPATHTDNGRTISRQRTLTPLYDDSEYKSAAYHSLTIDCLVGVGPESGVDPQMVLEISNDGGKTFKFAKAKSIGAIGEFEQKVKFRRLGISANRVFRISYGFPTEFAINNAFVDASL